MTNPAQLRPTIAGFREVGEWRDRSPRVQRNSSSGISASFAKCRKSPGLERMISMDRDKQADRASSLAVDVVAAAYP
jgi:hypothetical protein